MHIRKYVYIMHFEPIRVEDPDIDNQINNDQTMNNALLMKIMYLFFFLFGIVSLCLLIMLISSCWHFYSNYGTNYSAYFELIFPSIKFELTQIPKGKFITSLVQIVMIIFSCLNIIFFMVSILSTIVIFAILLVGTFYYCAEVTRTLIN